MVRNNCAMFTCSLILFWNTYRRLHKNYIIPMDKAYVRIAAVSNTFEVTFRYSNPQLRVDRQFNFCRSLDENVATFVNRIATNIDKVSNKKKRPKTDGDKYDTPSTVKLEGCENLQLTCKTVFESRKALALKIGEHTFQLIINSPWVDAIALPKSMMASFPVYLAKCELSFCDRSLTQFKWYRSTDKMQWLFLNECYPYTPTNEDINSYLKIECIPKDSDAEGPIAECVSDVAVTSGPGICPFETRQRFTTRRTVADECRVVSYNVLADLYCDSDFSRTELYPYCPSYALTIDYRKQLILKEILGYHADVICLQEVDRKVYNNDFRPVLSGENYESVFNLKGGQVAEGLACFFYKEKFRVVESNWIHLGEEIGTNELFRDIWSSVCSNEPLAARITQRQTKVQTVVLEVIGRDELLVVANTHLYFHPDADHIRLIQGAMAIRQLDFMSKNVKRKFASKRVSLIFCGDFNSTPECGIYRLYTEGKVCENDVDWKSNAEEAVTGLGLSQPLKLESACGTPTYTNYTKDFTGCLDYIYYEPRNMRVSRVIPFPSHEEIARHVALPSVVSPSDHISLVADLKWTVPISS